MFSLCAALLFLLWTSSASIALWLSARVWAVFTAAGADEHWISCLLSYRETAHLTKGRTYSQILNSPILLAKASLGRLNTPSNTINTESVSAPVAQSYCSVFWMAWMSIFQSAFLKSTHWWHDILDTKWIMGLIFHAREFVGKRHKECLTDIFFKFTWLLFTFHICWHLNCTVRPYILLLSEWSFSSHPNWWKQEVNRHHK